MYPKQAEAPSNSRSYYETIINNAKRMIYETKIDCINLQQNMENTVQQEVRFKKRMKRSNDYDLAIEKLLKKQKKMLNAV